MPREVIEYRAVAVWVNDQGETDEDYSGWVKDLGTAKVYAEWFRSPDTGPPEPDWRLKEQWIERRKAIYGEPERVKEGEGDAV